MTKQKTRRCANCRVEVREPSEDGVGQHVTSNGPANRLTPMDSIQCYLCDRVFCVECCLCPEFGCCNDCLKQYDLHLANEALREEADDLSFGKSS